MGRERQRFDFDDFETVPQKFPMWETRGDLCFRYYAYLLSYEGGRVIEGIKFRWVHLFCLAFYSDEEKNANCCESSNHPNNQRLCSICCIEDGKFWWNALMIMCLNILHFYLPFRGAVCVGICSIRPRFQINKILPNGEILWEMTISIELYNSNKVKTEWDNINYITK